MAARETTSQLAFATRLGIAAGDLARALGPLLFAVWLVLVVAPGRPNLGAGVYDASVNVYGMFAALFLAYAAYLVIARKLPDPTPLDWCAAALVAAYAIASLASVDPRMSLEASLQVGACVGAFYVFHERNFFSTNTLVRGLVFLAGVAGLLSLVQVGIAYLEWAATLDAVRGLTLNDFAPPPVLRGRGVLNHPNILAMFLNMALPFALAIAVRPRLSHDRLLGGFVVVIVCITMLFSQSRGAWLGTLVAQPLFWLLLYLGSGHRLAIAELRQWTIHHRRTVVTVAGLAFFAMALGLAYVLVVQPPWLFRATLGTRFDTVSAGLNMFFDYPLTGAGPNSFGLLHEAYGIEKTVGLYIAHNAYVQLLADVGLVGTLAVVAGAVVLARSMLLAWRRAGPGERLLLAACVSALAASLVHGLFESPAAWNSLLLPFTLVLAIAMRLHPPLPQSSWSVPASAARFVPLGLIPVLLGGWLVIGSGHSHYDASLRAMRAGQLERAAAAATAAAADDPNVAAYQLNAGVSLVTLSLDPGTSSARPGALEEGISRLSRAAQLDPHSSLAFANLALALQLQGDNAAAAEAARRALVESPADAVIARVAGAVLEDAGLLDGAVTAYAIAVRLEPALAQSPFWSSTPERASMRPDVVAAAGLDACEQGRLAALFGVYRDDLQSLAFACRDIVENPAGSTQRGSLALMLFALGDEQAARIEAESALSTAPSSPDTDIARAVVLADGDLKLARTALYSATQSADPSAAGLLAYTYLPEGTAAPEPLSVPTLPQRAEQMPARIRDQVERLAPSSAESPADALQTYRSARMYYTHSALREAPATLLIPGEWSDLVSPPVLLALQSAPAH